MAVEERQPFLAGGKIGVDTAIPLEQHDIFQDARRGPAVNTGQLKRVPMQVHRVRVVGVVIECQAVSLSLWSTRGLVCSSYWLPLTVHR